MSDALPRRTKQRARRWHRYLGLLAAIPLLWFALSGVLLNHAQILGLNERMVTSPWILRYYNQLPEGSPHTLRVGDRHVTEWGGELFLDETALPLGGELLGAVSYQGQLVIATPERLGVFDGSAEMLLELDELSLPATPLQGVELFEGQLHLAAADQFYLLSEDFFSAEKSARSFVKTPTKELPPREKEALTRAVRSRRGMPLSRVILDAHSGRLFGWPGWLLSDLAALGLVILTLLGLRLYRKRRS